MYVWIVMMMELLLIDWGKVQSQGMGSGKVISYGGEWRVLIRDG